MAAFRVNSENKLGIETLGTFIDERYAPWAREHVGNDAATRLKTDFAGWLSEPLTELSAWRIESWRRDQRDALTQPQIVRRQLLALDSCLSKAAEWLLIERNPVQDVSLEADTHYIIELFAGGIGQGYLREGWEAIGVNWTWTLGHRAVLELPPISGEADYVLKMYIAGIYKGNPQRLIVGVNGMAVGIILCRGPASFEFLVPAGALNSRDPIDVVLDIPDACQPVDDAGSTDKGFLGIRVAKIELQPLTRSQQKAHMQSPAADDLPGVLEQRAALQEMAGLGFNCEFGLVQRHVGAEPMSLFRWSNAPIDKLIEGLEKRFAGLTARDALEVIVNSEGKFVVEDKVYGFRHHTFVSALQAGALERVQRNEYVRIGILCKTLLEDLRERKKLFVYHDAGASNLEDIRRLVRALQIYGNNTLLWIVGTPTTAQIGETRQIERGLIQGYVSGFQTGPIMPGSPHLPSWIKVACRAHQIWSKNKETQEQLRMEKQLQKIRNQ
jgi:hypothetical protein